MADMQERAGTIDEARERILSLMRGDAGSEEAPAEHSSSEAPSREDEGAEEEPSELAAASEDEQDASTLSEEAAPAEEPPSEEVGTEATQDELVSQFDELAEHLDVDVEYLYGLKVPVRVGDQSRSLTISELKDLAHKEYDLAKAEERIARERERLESSRTEQAEAFSEGAAVAAGFIDRLENQIEQDEAAIDWRALREEDSAEYSALKEEFRERKERLRKDKDELKTQWDTYQKQVAKDLQERQRSVIQAEQQHLIERIPEWRNQEVRTAEGKQIANFLATQGFKPEEISSVVDSRAVKIARMAMLYEHGAQQREVVTKQVKKLPKRVKASSAKPPVAREVQHEKDLRTRLRKSGTMKDAAALLKHRMLNPQEN